MRSSVVALETVRLRLEPLRESHAGEMVVVLADDRLYEFTGGEVPALAELEERYQRQVAGPSNSHETWCNWILRDLKSAQAIGFVQATITEDGADLAWLVGVTSQRLGFGVEAASAVCEWLTSSGVRRLTAHIHPTHEASQRVAGSLGMIRTGEIDVDGEEIWAAESTR